MKKLLLIILTLAMLSSCAPVLNNELMSNGIFDMRASVLKEAPDMHRGKLFIMGGIIINTKATEAGSMIEAVYVPVDSMGFLKYSRASGSRFMALYPKDKGLLEPMIYSKNREITLAGEFLEARPGKIEDMSYTYPVFEIKELYLWEERAEHYFIMAPPYPYPPFYPSHRYYYPWYYNPWYYDSWWR
ncbi:MAG: Slp family lipoprotein [Nitrospirae bacterium]|nr:Slp family lipoprotein [Nitrospirota bacterium]